MEKDAGFRAWRAPSGRLHLHRRCSGNGRPRDTKLVKITHEEYAGQRAKDMVCRCLTHMDKMKEE